MTFPLAVENFLSEEENSLLLNYSLNNQELYDAHTSSVDFWNKRCIYHHSILDSTISSLLKEKCIEIREKIIKIDGNLNLQCEYPQFVKWEKGWELTPHADNIEQDGVTPNATPWRSHGAVLYLNDDYEGGELFYPNLGIEIKPKSRMLAVHRADINQTHGVKTVIGGIRHTISTFLTYDQNQGNLI
jgi:predicted 2-oxoglutarate/Fe(II)-dependent dioxygenase YbiX